ncbi:MAG TPA: hypothetical protein VM425_06045 [Myxococcota bacterium]|nr:hypothetical protein [Myxococcota bacterium]
MFERFKIRDTAFPVTPASANGVKWYGFPKLHRRLSDVIRRSMEETARVCILNRGPWGAGKTHAATYFTEKSNIKKPVGTYGAVHTILVETPKQGSGAFYDLFKRIMNAVTFRVITDCVVALRGTAGIDKLTAALMRACQNEDIAYVLAHLDDKNKLETRAYLHGTVGLRDMRAIGAATKLTSDHDFACALNGIMWLLIHSGGGTKTRFNRVILWIDEMEDLVYFPTRYYLPFTQTLRGVIDKTSEHLTLFVNFTFTEPEELETIGSVLGNALMARINNHVVFEDSTEEDVEQYLLELLADNRTDGEKYSKTHPFDAAAFKMITEACATHTPRYINGLCDMLLRKLCESPAPKGDKVMVTREMIEDILPKLASQLEG